MVCPVCITTALVANAPAIAAAAAAAAGAKAATDAASRASAPPRVKQQQPLPTEAAKAHFASPGRQLLKAAQRTSLAEGRPGGDGVE